MTYFDWKYYKELLIGNKELEKVQREFTVVVIKIKNVSAFIAEFSPPSLCMSKKKKEKERKRGIQMLQKNYFVMCMQAGQKELQLYSNQMIFPLNKLPHNFCGGGNNFIVAYKKKMVFFSDCARVFFYLSILSWACL